MAVKVRDPCPHAAKAYPRRSRKGQERAKQTQLCSYLGKVSPGAGEEDVPSGVPEMSLEARGHVQERIQAEAALLSAQERI